MDIVNAISKVMRGVEFRDVIRILQVVRGARVPIIKFISTHKKYPRLMGDISARNRLASFHFLPITYDILHYSPAHPILLYPSFR